MDAWGLIKQTCDKIVSQQGALPADPFSQFMNDRPGGDGAESEGSQQSAGPDEELDLLPHLQCFSAYTQLLTQVDLGQLTAVFAEVSAHLLQLCGVAATVHSRVAQLKY